jgi:hypothetical protein
MASKRMTLTVRSGGREFCFETYGDPKYLDEWRAAGIEIYVLEYCIPAWVVDAGLERVWMFFSDILQLRNPLRSDRPGAL